MDKTDAVQNTGSALKNSPRVLYDACPLCASKDIAAHKTANCTGHQLYNSILGPTITWKKCSACGHVFTDGYFTEEASRIVFSKTQDIQKVGNDMERQRNVSAKMIERIMPFVRSGYWLDIGFGNGSLLFTAQEYGFTPVGVDLRENNVTGIRKFGIEAHCIDVAKLNHPDRYSVISMADVLEHVPFPKALLSAVQTLLKPDGAMLISMPNMDSALWKEMDKSNSNPYWAEIEHFHNFGRERLYSLLEECGFEPLSYGISDRYRACMEIVARKAAMKQPDLAKTKSEYIKLDPAPQSVNTGKDFTMTVNVAAATPAKKTVAKNPAAAQEMMNQGNLLLNRGRPDEALACYEKAIALNPDNAIAYFSKGNALKRLQQHSTALENYDRAIALGPQASFWLNKANTLREMGRLNEALASYDHAIALQSKYADAYNGKGATLRDLKRSKEALACYDTAIASNPKLTSALVNRGNILRELKRADEALLDYDQALALNSDFEFLEGLRQHTRMQLCDWRDYSTATKSISDKAGKGLRSTITFPFLALPSTPEEQLQCAKTFAARMYPPQIPLWKGEIYRHEKIRVAYLSSDLHEHATAYLMAGVFELHEKSKFEITALSFGPDDKSKMRKRLIESFDSFIDISSSPDEEAARLIREKEIDIVVDLKGYTQNARTGILSRRAAPVQVNFIGYPGTMGASYIDYIIADPVIIPKNQKQWYSEKIACLPDTYQPNDRKRQIASKIPSKAELGLPEKGFVFCSFNNSFKITPDNFDVWMRLLKAVEGSVLWLLEPSQAAAGNLRQEAQNRGVSPDRLVFAPLMKLEEHLARHRQADLFLDTLPYNAHTTASDALWAGLPIVTCLGQTFASRVAGSLLTSAGMPELITHSLNEYEKLALKLSREPSLLAAAKSKLANVRNTCALFDSECYTRNLEAAYIKMWERSQRGEQPESFSVEKKAL